MPASVTRSLVALQVALIVALALAPTSVLAATVQTDLWVYQHGDTVTVTGRRLRA